MDIQRIPAQTVLSDCVSVCKLDGLDVIRIIHPKASAAVSLFGGHLLSFQPTGKKEVLWMSKNADLSGINAIRGGVPVCWPWFGKAAEPSHGFARTRQWKLNEHRENNDGVILSLTLQDSIETRAIWPHAFHLELLIEITETLKINLISTNTDDSNIHIGGALHTYLNVRNIEQIAISGLGSEYIEQGKKHLGADKVLFKQEVDRIYTHAEKTVVIEEPHQDTLKISNSGHNSVVVWNPWASLCASMPDMIPDGYMTMVCVESCVYNRSIALHPGEKHTLSTEISNQ